MYKARRYYIKFLKWRNEYISNNTFIILLSIQVGIIAAFAALFLKSLIHFIENSAQTVFPAYMFFVLPSVGIFLTVWLYNKVFKRAKGFHGIPGVLDAIRKRFSFIHYSLMLAQMITGALTIGLGGSSGLESPTVVTGSAIGAGASRFFRLDYKYRTLFIGCGTAAAIAAIFNAPIAGVIFATEVILPQFSTTIFIPILISSATGAFFSNLFLGNEVLFKVSGVSRFTLQEIPLLLVMGLFCGFVSLYFTKVFYLTKVFFGALRNWRIRLIAGGVLLGTLVYFFPVLFGEGYIGINTIIKHKAHVLAEQSVIGYNRESVINLPFVLGILMLVKPLAASITISAGGEGGQFAPSFVTGGFAGYFFYLIAYLLLPHAEVLNPVNYILLGMGAVLAGVMHAPLTAIFLVAEVTESYDLFIGLMLVTAMSFFVKNYFDKVPVYFQSLRTELNKSSKQEFITINNIRTRDLINKEFLPLYTHHTLNTLFDLFSKSSKTIFPVLNHQNEFVGIISVNEIRAIINKSLNTDHKTVNDIVSMPETVIDPTEHMDLVLNKFDSYPELDYIPVVKRNKFIGFISRTDVLNAYRNSIKNSGEILSKDS
jgi:CIC family chloride channel protein